MVAFALVGNVPKNHSRKRTGKKRTIIKPQSEYSLNPIYITPVYLLCLSVEVRKSGGFSHSTE